MKISMKAMIAVSAALLIGTGCAMAQSTAGTSPGTASTTKGARATNGGAAPGTNSSVKESSIQKRSAGSAGNATVKKQKINQNTGASPSTMKPISKQKGNQAKTAPKTQ